MSLNESSNVPYVLGRLFSVLETIQSVANPGINATIKDRYFNSACATPATAFPTLVKLDHGREVARVAGARPAGQIVQFAQG